jgi:hypothetical protein
VLTAQHVTWYSDMRLSLFESLLLIIGIVSFPLLWFPLVKHIRNRAFAKRIKVLEELMDSKLVCVFRIIDDPTVEICGTYKGRVIKFSSYIAGRIPLIRIGEFILTSSKLPKQMKRMLVYPGVSENVDQVGDKLVYNNCADFVSHRNVLEKPRAIQILDELVEAAEKCEAEK